MKNSSTQNLNSKGAATIFMVMSILAAVLAIALGTSFVASTELRLSSSSRESVTAYYAAETGIEHAMYDMFKGNEEPTAANCIIVPPEIDCTCPNSWTVIGDAQSQYCLKITETTSGDYTKITKVQSIGEYNSVRRSVEITF